MRILFLSTWFPFPTTNGSKLRVYSLLRGLAQQHEVTLLSFIDRIEGPDLFPELRVLCRDIHIVPQRSFAPGKKSTLFELIDPIPRSIQKTYSPEMAQCIKEILSTGKFDLVIASQLGTALYNSCFRNIPALFEEAEMGTLYEKYAYATSPVQKLRNGLTWLKHRRYIAGLLPHFQACTVASEQEMQLIAQEIPEYQSIEVIPNFINLADYQDILVDLRPDSLIFSGPFRYFANHEAMVWFLEEVYPLIQAQVPDLSLTITGDHADLPLPPASNVTLTGVVDDIRPLIASSSVSLVPLQAGGGTRLKILEAMALGVPVVSTLKGAEGLEIRSDEHLLIADTPEAFAENVIRVLRDPALRKGITDRARRMVEEKYDWAVVMPHFLDLVGRVGKAPRPPEVRFAINSI